MRRTWGSATTGQLFGREETSGDRSADRTMSTTEMLNQVDRLVELIEERVLREIERRGGRYRGGF